MRWRIIQGVGSDLCFTKAAAGWEIDYRKSRTAGGLLRRQAQQVRGGNNGGLDLNGDVEVMRG